MLGCVPSLLKLETDVSWNKYHEDDDGGDDEEHENDRIDGVCFIRHFVAWVGG